MFYVVSYEGNNLTDQRESSIGFLHGFLHQVITFLTLSNRRAFHRAGDLWTSAT